MDKIRFVRQAVLKYYLNKLLGTRAMYFLLMEQLHFASLLLIYETI